MRRHKKSKQHKNSLTVPGAKALAAGAAIAAGTQAYAAPIRFDNPAHGEPGHFHWPMDVHRRSLNIILDAGNQTNELGVFAQYYGAILEASFNYVECDPLFASVEISYPYNPEEPWLTPVPANDPIPSSGASGFGAFGSVYGRYAGGPADSPFPEHQDVYFGVRINLLSAWHYGWIGVNRTGYTMEAFAWGYETEPGVPIAAGIPEPDTLAMLAIGFVAAGTARRRYPNV
jgi:hypothetical protein